MKRRIYLSILFALAVGAAVLFVEWVPERQHLPVKKLTLIVATDLHDIAPGLTDHGSCFQRVVEQADGKFTQYAEELTDAFFAEVIAIAPDALILSGDLTFNGAKESHFAMRKKLQTVSDAGISVLALPGNHDIDNPMAASFYRDTYTLVDSISAEQFQEIYRAFGYEQAIARDTSSASYICPLGPGFQILMVDTNTPQKPGWMTEETLSWIETQLKKAREQGQEVIAVSHQTLLAHNPLFSDGFTMGNHEKLLALYQAYHVVCNLSGHMHIQHIAQDGLPELVTSSLAVSPHQYGILTLEGTSAHYQTRTVNVSAWAEQVGATDSTLLNFSTASADFFRGLSRERAMEALRNVSDADALADFFADVNVAYFSGQMDAVDWNSALFDRWRGQNAASFILYLMSIQDEVGRNYQSFDFSWDKSP